MCRMVDIRRSCADLRLPRITWTDGMRTEQILAEHPSLTAEDIHESLLYAAEAVRERELPLRRTA